MSAFQAKIKLGQTKKGPLTHVGFKGRTMQRGGSFTSTSTEEAVYYKAQPGFSVTVLKGKLPSAAQPEEEVELPEEVESDDEEETSEPEAEVKGTYERADLKKMSRDDLLALIKDDDDLPLKLKEVPKKASKREIIDLILGAQTPDSDDSDDDEEEDD
jgi:hypothetical protein